MINIILCGGSGTRLWPLSRVKLPKQFARIIGEKSLFQLTINRNSHICDSFFVVTNREHYFLAVDQMSDDNITQNTQYMLEPVGRNTAPAVALACMQLDREEIVLVTPSDHLIKNLEKYTRAVTRGKELAAEGFMITFGIEPKFPETGFGYIEHNGEKVVSFKEKPDYDTACEYVKKGGYLWNSGMFCFKAGVYLDELKKFAPQVYKQCEETVFDTIDTDFYKINKESMMKIQDISIDYAVMEKSGNVKVVVSGGIDWNDVGSFDALSEELPNDENNNMIIADKCVAAIDIHDMIIVDTDDALLVAKKGSSQKVKDYVAKLIKEKSDLPNIHRTAVRPWGSYTVLQDTNGYKMKKLFVKPGKRLSMQKHMHRNEHWIVVSGTATVTVEDKTYLVRPNESTYIRMGDAHRIANEGMIPLIVIEVQVGEYTGEDDIVRIQDDYDRI